MTHTPEAFFLPVDSPVPGQRFCIFHPAQLLPGSVLRGRVVYIHPFAEEMNKSRRMAALQSRALAAAGFSVLQIDLLGCGDSSGDFGDASWQDWIEDVVRACAWLRQRDAMHAQAPLWLWGLRAGCLLAVAAAPKLPEPMNFCFWQPTIAGSSALQQFLRLKLSADLVSGSNKGLMGAIRGELAGGNAVEVAGYALTSSLANGLELAKLTPPSGPKARLEWFEITTREGAALTPVASEALSRWSVAGFESRGRVLNGPQFWQTTEIEEAIDLIDQTCAALQPSGVAA